jgi:dihydrofolate synthase/folylpolyglutamate synthase
MNYQETLDWLFGLEARGIKFGLSNISELLGRMGDPHREYRSVHVAGTNGKGSVCALVASVLMRAGYKVGLYTSPHILDFGERVQVNGFPLAEKEMLRLAEEVKVHSDSMASESPEKRMTFFELTTAMAFQRFAEEEVDWAVVEMGMGGRLDATNVLSPDATVITRIAVEHTEFLGETVYEIAGEKAGIIKPGVRVITGALPGMGLEPILSRAGELESPVTVVDEDQFRIVSSTLKGTAIEKDGIILEAPLPGRFQAANMALAFETIKGLKDQIDEEEVVKGFSETRWPGRIETVLTRPRVILDATHTGDGAAVVAKEIRRMVEGDIILVLGVLGDKDLEGMARNMGGISRKAIATSPRSKRSFSATAVEKAFLPHVKEVIRIEDVGEAVATALGEAGPEDTVLVTGSLYTLGEARRWLDDRM